MDVSVAGRDVVVVGAGRSGRAAAELLVSRGARVTVNDAAVAIVDRSALEALGVAVELGAHRAERLAAADLVVLSPGVPAAHPAVEAARRAGVPVIGEIELASRWLSGRMVAITGTKGKSTTTTLAARMFAEAGFDATAGGNLGEALSGQVAGSRPGTLHVIEVSSFQLETTQSFRPWIAVLLNLSADHLDRHGSVEVYGHAKARIFANQTADDWAVVNADDPAALALARAGRARRFDFALETRLADGVTVEGEQIVRRDSGAAAPLLPLSAVRLEGRHLLSDVLAAAAVGCVAGVPPAAMRRAVEQFRGLEHALEPAGEIGGVRFVNDSKATNVVAARRAIETFAGGLVVIMGGRFKGGRLEDLREAVQARARAIVAIGEARPLLQQAFADLIPVHQVESLDAAVELAARLAEPGGVVLLAPACASFDQFEDYAARGRAFKAAVARLAAGGTPAAGAGEPGDGAERER